MNNLSLWKLSSRLLKSIIYENITVVLLAIICGLLLYIESILPQYGHQISEASAKSEFIPHIFLVVLVCKIYKNADAFNRRRLFWMATIIIGLLVNHFIFYILVYLQRSLIINNHFLIFLLDFIPHLAWILSGIIFLSYVNRNVIHQQNIVVLVLCNLILIVLFLTSIKYAFEIWSWQSASQILLACSQFFIFDYAIICLIYSENRWLSNFLLGFIILISGNLLIIYSVVSQTLKLLVDGRILWLTGLLIMSYGLFGIYKYKCFDVKSWFVKTQKIKNMFALWSFATFIAGFILICVIAYTSTKINKEIFIGLPVFVMIYSIISVCFSILIGKTFEAPFKQIENNIEELMSDSNNPKVNDKFSTEEFIFLQKFIFTAFKDKEEKDRTKLMLEEQEKFRKAVGQMMHDITSPIASINTIVSKLNKTITEDDRVTLMHAAARIEGISQQLLNKYDNKNDEESIESLLVSLVLLQIFNEKKVEYKETAVKFEIDINEEARFCFINHNLGIFKRMISNLINNAVDAVKDKTDASIQVTLSVHSGSVFICIKDNGYGMPLHVQEKFNQGLSITEGKINGRGIGLMQIKDAIKFGNGDCRIEASGLGTKIVVYFPERSVPKWISTEIKLKDNDTVIILDDDESIHGAWDNIFDIVVAKIPNLQIQHYTNGKDVIQYINSLTSTQKQNLFLLTDYELLEQGINGLDVVEHTHMDRAILVTSYATQSKIQNRVMHLGIKILPKELVSVINVKIDNFD